MFWIKIKNKQYLTFIPPLSCISIESSTYRRGEKLPPPVFLNRKESAVNFNCMFQYFLIFLRFGICYFCYFDCILHSSVSVTDQMTYVTAVCTDNYKY